MDFFFTLGCISYISAQRCPAVKLRRQALHAWRPLQINALVKNAAFLILCRPCMHGMGVRSSLAHDADAALFQMPLMSLNRWHLPCLCE